MNLMFSNCETLKESNPQNRFNETLNCIFLSVFSFFFNLGQEKTGWKMLKLMKSASIRGV